MRFIVGFIAFVAFIILAIVLIARTTSRGGDTELDLAPAPQLVDVAPSDANFVYTVSGPIVAEEDHTAIRITVSRVGRRVEVIRGYQNTVVAQENFGNNENAFRKFLAGLDRAGYDDERETRYTSEEDLCPNGRRFVFESNQHDQDFRRWSTSCRTKGDFGGALRTTQELFRNQIPDYNNFIRDTRKDTGLTIRN